MSALLYLQYCLQSCACPRRHRHAGMLQHGWWCDCTSLAVSTMLQNGQAEQCKVCALQVLMTRHTVMVVGQTGGGKSVILQTLARSQTKMGKRTTMNVLNPKVQPRHDILHPCCRHLIAPCCCMFPGCTWHRLRPSIFLLLLQTHASRDQVLARCVQ